MLLDKETKIWHCVHIIQQINGEYLLDWAKRQEKWLETHERIGREMVENAYLSTEEREQSYDDFVKEGWKSKLAKEYATDKQIRAQVRELRQAEQLPKRPSEYRPNIKGIRYVFAENAAQVKLVLYKHIIENNPTTYQHGDENHRKYAGRNRAM